jgi:EAL domain-containing protein (putative c-di-GMP-specific phosphodiesterase class I)
MTPHSMLDELLVPGALRIEFQPVLKLDGDGVELYALEALTRGPRGTTMERPDVLFEYARRRGEEARVDLNCVAAALASAATLPCDPVISINIHGSTLSSVERFPAMLLELAQMNGIAVNRLMLEIVEHRSPWAIGSFQVALRELREAGVRIALDDLGVGASNYHLFVECRPDHIKIDRYLVKGCSSDPYRIAVLRSIVTLAAACDAIPIAEGVEFHEDLSAVLDLGINHVQGWMFSRSLTPEETADSRYLKKPRKEKTNEKESTARR